MISNVLDFALDYFGPQDESGLYAAVSVSTPTQLEEFVEEYRCRVSNGLLQPPELKNSELRPYLHTNHDLPAWAKGGLQLDLEAFETSEKMWRTVDAIKHRLLYCHSVALNDPLSDLATLAAAQMRQSQPGRGMTALLNYVQLLIHMGKLLRDNVLCLVPPAFYSPARVGPYQQRAEMYQRLSSVPGGRNFWKQADIQEILKNAPETTRTEWESALHSGGTSEELIRSVNFDAACQRIADALSATTDLKNCASIYLPYRYDIELLLACQSALIHSHLPGFRDADNWLLSRVIDMEVPGLCSLDPEQIVELRSDSAEFAMFRNELSSAIRAADSLPMNTLDRAGEIKRLTSVELASAKEKLELSLGKSPTLAALRKGSIAILGGTLSAAVVAGLDPTKVVTLPLVVALLAGASISGVITGVAAASEIPEESSARKAALAHYVAML